MPTVRLTVREPSIEGLDELLDDLRGLGDDYDVEVEARPYTGYGVTWGQLFFFVIDETGRHVVDAIEGVFLVWAWNKLRHERKQGRRGRPRVLTIYGPDGETLKAITVSEPDEPAEDSTEERESDRTEQERP